MKPTQTIMNQGGLGSPGSPESADAQKNKHLFEMLMLMPGRNRFGSIRFGSVILEKSSVRFGSVRFGSETYVSLFDAVRPAFFGRVVARSSSVRFGSASGSGRFRNYTVRFSSVRLVRFGFLLLPAFLVAPI